jgi:hypothetical protein
MHNTKPKPFVFVLMPFAMAFDDVYQLGIKPAAEEAGAYCERIDEQIFVDSVLARIYNQIAKADLIVADMTSRNANVFYEVGYAHALGKTVILLTRDSDDIPFDLKHYPHIIYGDSIKGMRDNLTARILFFLSNLDKPIDFDQPELLYTIAGTVVVQGATIEIPIEANPHTGQRITIGINNPTDTVIQQPDMSVALILPEFFPASAGSGVQLPDKRFLHDLGMISRMLPGGWDTFYVTVERTEVIHHIGKNLEAELRAFTPSGPVSTNFVLNFIPPRQ